MGNLNVALEAPFCYYAKVMNLAEPILKLFKKKTIPNIEVGDTVRVHQKIKEGGKERIQVFEGVVIAKHKTKDLDATFTVRKIASGVGVEKVFLLHSPNIAKIEFKRSSKIRRSKLYYLRQLTGKALKLQEKKGVLKDSWELIAATDQVQTEASAEDIAEAVVAEEARKQAEVVNQEPAESGTVEEGGEEAGGDNPQEVTQDEDRTAGGADAEEKPAESGDREPDQKFE